MPDLFGWYTPPASSLYNEGLVSLLDDPYQIKVLRPQLQQAGLWNPEWDAWANFQAEGDSSATPPPMPDFSSLSGYKLGAGNYGGGNRRADLVGPDGSVVVDNPYFYDEPSMGEQAVQGALFVGGAALGMNALFNPAGAMGAFGGGAAAPASSGIGTLPSSVGAPLGQAAPLSTMGAPAGAAGGVPGATLPAAASTLVPAATASGFDPITAYLTTGASEGSTMLNGVTGAGGAAGAVGAGSTAGMWDTALRGLASGGARSIFDIGSGLYGMSLANKAREASDPFAKYRGYYGDQMMQLQANPGSITQVPGWRAGLEGLDRQMAARGYYGSGNMDAARSQYAGDFYQKQMALLGGLAGANQAPGAGQFSSADLIGRSLASIGYGLAPWIGGPAAPPASDRVKPLPVPAWGRPS